MQLHPRVVAVGDCCLCFKMKVDKWERWKSTTAIIF